MWFECMAYKGPISLQEGEKAVEISYLPGRRCQLVENEVARAVINVMSCHF